MQCIPPESRSYIIKSYHPVLALPEPFTSLALKGSYCCKSVAYNQTDPWWLCPSFGFGTLLDLRWFIFQISAFRTISGGLHALPGSDLMSSTTKNTKSLSISLHASIRASNLAGFSYSGGLYIFLMRFDAWKILHLCCTLLMRALMERGSSYRATDQS